MKKLTIIIFISLSLGGYKLSAQNMPVYKVQNHSRAPRITWFMLKPLDTVDFEVYRSRVKTKKFEPVHSIHYREWSAAHDTMYVNIIDTTLTKKGIYLYYVKAKRNGKEVMSATAMAHNFGLLPKPNFIDFKATPLKDRKAVKLEWKLNYSETVNSMTLYRSRGYDKDFIRITDLNPEDGTYIDPVPVSNEPWFYFVIFHNYFGGDTKSMRMPAFATFAEKPFPPQDQEITYKNDTVKLMWRNVGHNIIGYRIYRKIDEEPFSLLQDMQENLDEKMTFIDTDKRLKKAVEVKYYVRNVSDGFIESNIIDTLEVYMPEHQPVYPPAQVDYVRLPGGGIKLLWMPDKRGFVTGYNVYVKRDGKINKLNQTTLHTNSYTDKSYLSPGKYVYLIEGVGVSGKTSEGRTPVSVKILPQSVEVLLNLKNTGKAIEVSWNKPLNKNVSKLLLYRQTGKNNPVFLKSFPADKDGKYNDYKLKRKNTYMYRLKAQLKNGENIWLDDAAEIRY